MTLLLLDVNVVVAAHRPQHQHHQEVRSWWDQTVNAAQTFAVPAMIWASFLRLVTNRRVFSVPSTVGEAFGFIEALRGQPEHIHAEPGPRHLELLKRLCADAEASGDLVPDAVLAAIAIEHGATVVTLDRDFARFSSVAQLRPTAPPAPSR